MAKSESKSVMPFIPAAGGNLPAHLQKDKGLGSENVTNDALETPRLTLLQTLSPQCNKRKAEYVEGAEEGLFFNTVTQELMTEVYCLNLYFEKTFVIWRTREAGGGYVGQFDSMHEANQYIHENNLDPVQHQISETDNHYLLLVDETGKVKGPAITNMSSTRLRASRSWNTQLQQLMGEYSVARFASVWKLTSYIQESKENSWANMQVENAGFASEDLYDLAKKSYENILAGKNKGLDKAA